MAAEDATRRTALLLTCEHGGNRIPRQYAVLFRGARAELESHRGWDPGALALAQMLSRELRAPLLSTSWSRLLVEANRSLHNPRLWSKRTRALPKAEREQILERYWRPHRSEVETAVARSVRRGARVVHVAVHSFTPRLRGEVRNADVGLLYDSGRARETALARRWKASLRVSAARLRVRYNYPYRGGSDGLTTSLRRQHAPASYLGLELEVNQALLSSSGWRTVGAALASTLAQALDPAESL
jgi:predicted N-formylglutamate amidohydrolase